MVATSATRWPGREPAPWPATFVTGPAVDELETLVLAPDVRGAGIGSTLLDADRGSPRRGGPADRAIGVVPGNVRATALYAGAGSPDLADADALRPTGRTRPGGRPRAVASVAPDEVDALDALWLELHHHHQAVAPQLGPFVADGPSWQLVRALFVAAAGDGLLLRTGPAGRPVRRRLRGGGRATSRSGTTPG